MLTISLCESFGNMSMVTFPTKLPSLANKVERLKMQIPLSPCFLKRISPNSVLVFPLHSALTQTFSSRVPSSRFVFWIVLSATKLGFSFKVEMPKPLKIFLTFWQRFVAKTIAFEQYVSLPNSTIYLPFWVFTLSTSAPPTKLILCFLNWFSITATTDFAVFEIG